VTPDMTAVPGIPGQADAKDEAGRQACTPVGDKMLYGKYASRFKAKRKAVLPDPRCERFLVRKGYDKSGERIAALIRARKKYGENLLFRALQHADAIDDARAELASSKRASKKTGTRMASGDASPMSVFVYVMWACRTFAERNPEVARESRPEAGPEPKPAAKARKQAASRVSKAASAALAGEWSPPAPAGDFLSKLNEAGTSRPGRT
jgi:hypothetical protein